MELVKYLKGPIVERYKRKEDLIGPIAEKYKLQPDFKTPVAENYKGQAGDLVSMFMTFGILTIVIAVTLLISTNVLQQVSTLSGNTSDAYQGVETAVRAVKSLTDWLPIIVVVIIGAFLVGLVIQAFKGPANL